MRGEMSNKILILLIGVLVVLMLGLGGGLFMMWNKLSAMNTQGMANANEQLGQNIAPEQPLGPIFSLETFIVNLADKGGKRYLRVSMDLELDNKEMEEELQKRLPQVRDSILMILPTKRFEDINSADGKISLRNEMVEELNRFLTTGRISNIYFKEFVVQ
jgi:flagellar FliL protein